MRGGSLNRFISQRKKQDEGDLKDILKQVLISGIEGGVGGLRSSRSLADLRRKPIKGFKQGIKQSVKRKARQVIGKEAVKRARDIFGI